MHLLGLITLNLSTAIYFIWFIPQLKLTFKRKSISGLSLLMHSILMVGYLTDLMYGFGRGLPIQYRLVTLVGLGSLLIEHYQFARYGLTTLIEKRFYMVISIGFILLSIGIIDSLFINIPSKTYYNIAGFISMTCWLIFMWPQIIKNYVNQSSSGLSVGFVWLSVLAGICDIISAYTLNWAMPSKIGAPLGLIKKTILLGQCYYYKVDATTLLKASY